MEADVRTITTEFPDFDTSTLPAIPAGFEDSSWHNDSCPSWHHEGLGLSIYIDYVDPSQRECQHPEGPRFSLLMRPDDEPHALCHTDDWQEVLETIEAYRATMAGVQ